MKVNQSVKDRLTFFSVSRLKHELKFKKDNKEKKKNQKENK